MIVFYNLLFSIRRSAYMKARNFAPAVVADPGLDVDVCAVPSVAVAPPWSCVPVCDDIVSLLLKPVGWTSMVKRSLLCVSLVSSSKTPRTLLGGPANGILWAGTQCPSQVVSSFARSLSWATLLVTSFSDTFSYSSCFHLCWFPWSIRSTLLCSSGYDQVVKFVHQFTQSSRQS